MKVKMIQDKGVLKKGKVYDLAEKKAISFLTEGFCHNIRNEPKLKKIETGKIESKTTKEGKK